jgi:hypothetical protein
MSINRKIVTRATFQVSSSVVFFISTVCLWASFAAYSAPLKPFILAEESSADFAGTANGVKEKLTGAGYKIVGSYEPFDDNIIYIITNDKMIASATASSFGAWAAVLRVSVSNSRSSSKFEVSFYNPTYMAHAYRLQSDDFSWLTADLKKVLGFVQEFGSEVGLTPAQLAKYHYTTGMEHFDEWMELADWDDHASAVAKVDGALAENSGGVHQIYKFKISDSQVMYGLKLTEGVAGDEKLLGFTDCLGYHHTAHLPYEMLVKDGSVLGLAPRFRIASSFPDLKMVGSCSFMGIMQSPDEIKKALIQAAGKEYIIEADDEMDF